MSYRVRKTQCDTCIFGGNSPVGKERFAELQAAWQEHDTGQECHKHTVEQDDTACRGFYAAARRGNIPTPLRSRLEDSLSIDTSSMSNETVHQISERLGLVSFDDEIVKKRAMGKNNNAL